MKSCFRCKYYHFDYTQECVIQRNICEKETVDPISGVKGIQLCYLKNHNCECPDYEEKYEKDPVKFNQK